MPLSALSLAVVGIQHPNKRGPTRRFAVDLCRPGDPVELVHEPKNPADQNAVMVLNADGMQMGYIPADRTFLIHRAWGEGRGVAAIFQGEGETGTWIRVAFDGEQPTLPEHRDAEPSRDSVGGADWYPDEEYQT